MEIKKVSNMFKTKKYGKTTHQTDIKLKCNAIQAEDVHMNVKHVFVKSIVKVDDNNWLFTIRHDEKYLDKIREMTAVEELNLFNNTLQEKEPTIIITEDNIADYYESMSAKDKSDNVDIIHFAFSTRTPLYLADMLDIEHKKIIDSWKFTVTSAGRTKGQSLFGIKDTLKPINMYIEEIKASKQYLKA